MQLSEYFIFAERGGVRIRALHIFDDFANLCDEPLDKYVYLYVYVCVCMCVCMCARVRVCVCVYAYMYVCMHVCGHAGGFFLEIGYPNPLVSRNVNTIGL